MTEVTRNVGKNMVKRYNTNFSKLLMLILDMSEEQQSILLHQLMQQVQQVDDKRKKNRIPCLIPANYRIVDNSYHSFILDINDTGAFIETNEVFPIGQLVKLEYFDPFNRKSSKEIGEIVWSGPHSFGVKFFNDYGLLH